MLVEKIPESKSCKRAFGAVVFFGSFIDGFNPFAWALEGEDLKIFSLTWVGGNHCGVMEGRDERNHFVLLDKGYQKSYLHSPKALGAGYYFLSAMLSAFAGASK